MKHFSVLLALFAASYICRADEVDDYLEAAMSRQHIPGLSLAVIRDGALVKAQGYGLASVELEAPAGAETVYELASATKPFVATAIMLLAQDGKLSLEDRVSQYVEHTPDSWSEITIRHLLSHTSGVKDYLERPEMTPFDLPPEKIVEIAAGFPLNFPPGTKWAYSNTGYVLLAMVIQKVTDQSLGDFLGNRIFQPLGMNSTRLGQPDGVYPNRADGYLWLGPGGMRNADMFKFMSSNRGDAGILSTVLDLAKWDVALTNDELLAAANRESMCTATRLQDGSTCNYGLGWFINEINGHRHVYHPGGSAGAATIFSRYPEDMLTIILLANGGGAYPEGLDLGIAQRFISGLVPNPGAIDPEVLDSCTGYYSAYGRQLLEVTKEGDGLLLNDGGGLANVFLPLSTTEFVAEDANRGCVFQRSTSGNVTGMTLRLGVDEMPVPRIGPAFHAVKPVSDPNPALTRKVEAVLKALARGGKAVEDIDGITETARKDYARGPAPELAGIRSIAYVVEHDVTERGIERHGGKVSRVLYCRMLTGDASRHLLVYLTQDDLVTDQDVLRE